MPFSPTTDSKIDLNKKIKEKGLFRLVKVKSDYIPEKKVAD